jgi:acetoin utilization deacetylase AcuC-like enzyme
MSVVYSPKYAQHHNGSHPENQGRLEVIMESLPPNGIPEKLDLHEPQPAREEDLLRVHTSKYLEHLRSFTQNGGGFLDYDTFASTQSYEIAKLAAGGAIKASELVFNGYECAYSLARPPGHHATSNRAMGFCLINNMAVALEYLREKYKIKKFLILDFDAHYGNGTAEIFYQDPQVLYISIHQDPATIFPGKGFVEENGSGDGEGFNMNLPMQPGSTTSDYIYILEKILEPVFRQFKADFYFLDVGFDGHREDPLSSLQLDDFFYPWIASKLQKLTNSMVLILEGGYSLEVMARSNLEMMNVLMNHSGKFEEYNYTPNVVYKGQEKSFTSLNVKDETKTIFQEIKDIFSPIFTF